MLLCRDTGRDSELLNKSRSERKLNSTVNEDSIIEQDVDNFTNEHAPKFLRVPIRIEENEITKTYDFTDGSKNDTMVKAGNTDNYEFCMANNSILKQVKIEELESQMNRKRLKNLRKFENRKLNKEKNEKLDKNEQNQGHINEEAEYEQHLNQMNESLISTRNRTTLVSRNYRIPVMTRPRRNFM